MGPVVLDLADDDNDNDDVGIADADDGAWQTQTQNEQMTNQHTSHSINASKCTVSQFIIEEVDE